MRLSFMCRSKTSDGKGKVTATEMRAGRGSGMEGSDVGLGNVELFAGRGDGSQSD